LLICHAISGVEWGQRWHGDATHRFGTAEAQLTLGLFFYEVCKAVPPVRQTIRRVLPCDGWLLFSMGSQLFKLINQRWDNTSLHRPSRRRADHPLARFSSNTEL